MYVHQVEHARKKRARNREAATHAIAAAKKAAELDSLVDELVNTVVPTEPPMPPAPPAWSSLSVGAQRSLMAWMRAMDHGRGGSSLESGPPAVC